jgi:hypothetical protein
MWTGAIMRRILVGTRGGVAIINWPAVLLTGIVTGLVAGTAAAGTWYILTDQFHATVMPPAIALFVGWFAGESIRIRRTIPADKISPLE